VRIKFALQALIITELRVQSVEWYLGWLPRSPSPDALTTKYRCITTDCDPLYSRLGMSKQHHRSCARSVKDIRQPVLSPFALDWY
jgi:hypothetical protein